MVISWVVANWFALLQTVGIVGALAFNGYSLFINARIRKVDTLINITQQHRTIWLKFFDTPRIARILDRKIDLKLHPVKSEERLFVNLIILHLATVLTAVHKGIIPKPAGLDEDLRDFFSLAIPGTIWNEMRAFSEPRVLQYMDALLGHGAGIESRKSHRHAKG